MADVKGDLAGLAKPGAPNEKIEKRGEHLKRSPLAGRYDAPLDRESAYELLKKRAEASSAAPTPKGRARETIVETMAKSAVRAIGSQIGRQLVRGVLGSLLGGGGQRR